MVKSSDKSRIGRGTGLVVAGLALAEIASLGVLIEPGVTGIGVENVGVGFEGVGVPKVGGLLDNKMSSTGGNYKFLYCSRKRNVIGKVVEF